MTNASLKEQLQALAKGPEATPAPHKRSHKPTPGTKKTPPQLKPAWLEYAQYGVELLKAYFPLCFRDIKDVQPLKIGIKQDLVKALSTHDDIVISDKACMVSSLSYYVNSTAYHKSVVEGAMRIDLLGAPAGLISTAELD